MCLVNLGKIQGIATWITRSSVQSQRYFIYLISQRKGWHQKAMPVQRCFPQNHMQEINKMQQDNNVYTQNYFKNVLIA